MPNHAWSYRGWACLAAAKSLTCPTINLDFMIWVRSVFIFRTRVQGDFRAMSLLRTFFGRSEVSEASFHDCDLSESTFCWCDFIGVDFSDADLRASDLRASNFERVRFDRCDLRGGGPQAIEIREM